MKLVTIGDNVCDVYLHLETMFPGGQALNVAVYANMLGQESGYIGVFGRDDVSEHILEVLNELGTDYSHCIHCDGENGYAMVNNVEGERVFLGGNKGGIAAVTPINFTEEDLAYIRNFSVIHTSNNSFIDSDLPVLKATGIPISYDFSQQWSEDPEWMKEIAPYCTFAFCSLPDDAKDEEIPVYIQSFHELGVPNVIATFGKKGSFFSDGNGIINQPPNLVAAIDTLGAGDSFTTAFLVNYYNALEANPEEMLPGTDYYMNALKKALKEAAYFSSQTCLIYGAFGHGKKIDRQDFLERMKRPGFVRDVDEI